MKKLVVVASGMVLVLSGIGVEAGWRDKLEQAKDATKEKHEQVKESATDSGQSYSERYSSFKASKKDEAIEKLEEKMEELHGSLIEISKIGFVADEVRIVSGLPPHAEVFFSDTGETGKEAQVMAANAHKKVLSKVLKLLNDTRKINVAHYEIRRVKMDFTVPPKLHLVTNVDLNN